MKVSSLLGTALVTGSLHEDIFLFKVMCLIADNLKQMRFVNFFFEKRQKLEVENSKLFP